jgi:hypothetical protein
MSFFTRLILIIILFSSTNNLYAQIKSFWKISGPERWWVMSHPFIANKTRKITIITDSVSNVMKADSRLDGDANGGQVDAFRHAFWMALLSQKICWRNAISLGNAHEKGNYKQFKKGEKDEESSLPDSVSGEMDKFNNQIGAGIGCRNKIIPIDSLVIIILNEVTAGKMKIISKNSRGDYLDCNGNVIESGLLKGKWNVPKCLVFSNEERRK